MNKYLKTRMTAEEIHRCKQRKQYKLMLINLKDLTNVLPPVPDCGRPKTKQILISEATQYIHYLQLCIYQLGKETGCCDSKLLEFLHWASPCTDPCQCLDVLALELTQSMSLPNCVADQIEFPPDLQASIEKVGSVNKIVAGTSGQHLQNRSSTPSKVSKKRKCQTPKSRKRINGSAFVPDTPQPLDCPWAFSPIQPLKQPKRSLVKEDLDKSSDNEEATRTMNNIDQSKTLKSNCITDKRFKKKLLKKKRRDKKESSSPLGTVCDIITPPSSYRRTIIEDSPQSASTSHNWADVSVRRSSSPWMPKPDNVYGSIEDLAEEIVSDYEKRDVSDGTEDCLDDTFLPSSFAIESFLDSTDEDSLPLDNFKIKDFMQRPRTGVRDALLCQRGDTLSSPSPTQSSPPEPSPSYTSPDLSQHCRSQNITNDFSSPEHLLGFSPRLFLTGRRFDCS